MGQLSDEQREVNKGRNTQLKGRNYSVSYQSSESLPAKQNKIKQTKTQKERDEVFKMFLKYVSEILTPTTN